MSSLDTGSYLDLESQEQDVRERQPSAKPSTRSSSSVTCDRVYCSRSSGLLLVEVQDRVQKLCRACRKELWGVSS
jgi:hypothetical protein